MCGIGLGFCILLLCKAQVYFISFLLNTVILCICCKTVSERVSKNYGVAKEWCVFLRGSRSSLLVCVL